MLEELARLLSSYIPPQSQPERLTGWEDKEADMELVSYAIEQGIPWIGRRNLSSHSSETRHAEESGFI